MRKNKMMRLASGLLVAVLLTTCAISGTFAKYVTEGTGTDSARVAKFGVVVNTTSDSAFKNEYTSHTDGYASSTVKSADKVVAPGTSGSVARVALTGNPEVAVKVNYAADLELGNNWVDKEDDSKFYCPLKIRVNGTPLCGLNYESADDFESAVESLINGVSEKYAPGTFLGGKNSERINVEWEWSFTDSTTYLNEAQQTDEKDTFLGDRAAGAVGNAGTISLELTTTVTQID